MRLLNSHTLKMQEFIAEDEMPPYAILSHTWGEDEVSLLDMELSDVSQKKAFAKIQFCCDQAASDNLNWAWVDTYVQSHVVIGRPFDGPFCCSEDKLTSVFTGAASTRRVVPSSLKPSTPCIAGTMRPLFVTPFLPTSAGPVTPLK
jgi:hypothetical protein